jgi:hypothetical protein
VSGVDVVANSSMLSLCSVVRVTLLYKLSVFGGLPFAVFLFTFVSLLKTQDLHGPKRQPIRDEFPES